MALYDRFNRARIDDRLVNELTGICHATLADGVVSIGEVEYLQRWLVANSTVTGNPVVEMLLEKIGPLLEAETYSAESAREIFHAASDFVGGDIELGEVAKSSKLPLDVPYPNLDFVDVTYCFTGTFAFGSRKDCEFEVIERGGMVGRLTRRTDVLVIGSYVSSSWAHSNFGRKIEKAVEMKSNGSGLVIVSEDHWLAHL